MLPCRGAWASAFSILFFFLPSIHYLFQLCFFMFALNEIQKGLFCFYDKLPGLFAFFFTLTFDWDTTKLHFLNKKEKKKPWLYSLLYVVVKLHNEEKSQSDGRWKVLYYCAWSFRIQTTVTVNTKHGSGLACFSYQNAAALFEANESRDDFLANTHSV